MNRRKFLGGVFAGAAASAFAPHETARLLTEAEIPAILPVDPIRAAHTASQGEFLSELWSKEILKAYKDNLVFGKSAMHVGVKNDRIHIKRVDLNESDR